MINQRTIAKAVNFTGIGLHSGKKINLTLKPAEVDFGIQFQRVDILNAPRFKPTADSVSATENNTTIG
ncbi:MAG: UDP-3-O-acyl-N-acetylglucosamine deacetylase, partial [Bacteriovoracales bacterium]